MCGYTCDQLHNLVNNVYNYLPDYTIRRIAVKIRYNTAASIYIMECHEIIKDAMLSLSLVAIKAQSI